ncbi:MAG: heavy-metal-associated domain-containing protein [Bacteroidales bacterium]|nr:heavy-metal-associated domain-containing protein [Bacteroidales bacterium]
MKKVVLCLVVALMSFSVFAQKAAYQKVTIQTNGVCENCKKRMMDQVPQWKGVKSCTYDVQTGKLEVTYDAALTSPETLRISVSKLGYDADTVKADAAARAQLPACCTKPKSQGGCGNHSGGCGGCGHHH